MAYQTAITIKAAITAIQQRKYVLPAIQREFVWTEYQIERLFDSLMREYPISTFLFWKVERGNVNRFQFYEFLKDYHEKSNRHNKKADLSNEEDITAILDGQQRLTSLYIALRGSYARKLPYYRRDSAHAFPKKKLYLNLLQRAEDDELEMQFDFRFLKEDDTEQEEGFFWFPVNQILDMDSLPKVMQYLVGKGLMDTSRYAQDKINFAMDTLNQLFSVVHQRGIISFYQEEDKELDKVLQIFIRINSGGTKLSYSDLLLSVATAQWRHLDAREEIHAFVDTLNGIGNGFNFSKDFVMKSCLVLGDFNDVRFKVDNFTRDVMHSIEDQWENISKALQLAVELISSYGFYGDNLTSTNAVIPIAYYLFKNGYDRRYLESSRHAQDRQTVLEWLAKALLLRVFSGTPDSVYPPMRNIIKENLGSFPLAQITEKFKGGSKSIVFAPDDLEALLDYQYGSPFTYALLTLLYSGLNNQFHYHIDHLHPRKFFTDKHLRKAGVTDVEERQGMINSFNHLANLQLLQGTVNMEKNAKPLDEFLMGMTPRDRQQFRASHFFPKDVETDLASYSDFFAEREAVLRKRLAEVLNVELPQTSTIDSE
jgi:uncharacterized protein with ParB-like and HNH nuclease domain